MNVLGLFTLSFVLLASVFESDTTTLTKQTTITLDDEQGTLIKNVNCFNLLLFAGSCCNAAGMCCYLLIAAVIC